MCFHWNIPPKTRKLITLANCSSSVCLIVLVKSTGYTRTIFCYVSAGENSKSKPAFAEYGDNTHKVVRQGYYYHRYVKCLDASNYEEVFFNMIPVLAKSMTEEDIVYIRAFLNIEKPKFHRLQKFQNTLRMIAIHTSYFRITLLIHVLAATCDFHQCRILTSADSKSRCSFFLRLETPYSVWSVA